MRRSLAITLLGILPALVAGQTRSVATFSGVVVDSAKSPIANAEVSFPGMSMQASTNDKGVFHIADIPAGIHRLTIRHLGFASLDTTVAFADGQTIERRVTLGTRVVTLDSIVATDAPASTDPLMVQFEENRARGFGRFLTRADLEKMQGRNLGNAMTQLAGLDIVRGYSGEAWVAGKHAPLSGCSPTRMSDDVADGKRNQAITDQCLRRERVYYVPDDYEVEHGMRRTCFAQVYVDRDLMNPGRPTRPFDLNTFSPERLEAVEWYADAAQTPARYSAREAQCGVAILHQRKSR
jgi:hypothetical protein